MSNPTTKHDLTNSIIRPKRLYLTSEDIEDFNSSAACRFTLKESISAEEGFRLVYGLKSFGYIATANNISERQENNRLHFQLAYWPPLYHIQGGLIVENPESGDMKVQDYEIIIPDGFYPTLDDLFRVMNDPKINMIPSGVKVLVDDDTPRIGQTISAPNDIPLLIVWSVEQYGYSVTMQLGLDQEIYNDYSEGGGHYQAYEMNPRLIYLDIIPGGEKSQNLYKILFTNENSQRDVPANIPASLPFRGPNPPGRVRLFMNFPFSYQEDLTNPADFIDPMFGATFSWKFNGIDDALNTDQFLRPPETTSTYECYSFGYSNLPLQIWYAPRLFPLYIEISSSLETQNLTVDGYASNLLLRHFPMGSENGAKSFFQSWDQPLFHHMRSARNQIDGIKLEFNSESNKWDFYNLNFFIEFMIYEIPDDDELPTFDDSTFAVPTEDAMTASLQQYSNKFHDPFPIHSSGSQSGVLRLGSSRSGELKKRRR